MTIEEQLEKSVADLAAATELLNAAQADQTAKAEKISELEKALAEKTEGLDQSAHVVESLNAENKDLAAKVEELSTQAKDAETRAVEIVAAAGVPAVPVADGATQGAPMTKEQAWDQYKQLPDERAKTAFFRANRGLLIGQ